MFNSQKINTDPEPWHVVEADDEYGNGRYSQRQYEASRDSTFHSHGGTVYNLAEWKPRAEFDNNPNPILLDFRVTREVDPEYTSDPVEWLETVTSDMSAGEALSNATPAHHDHARRVLSKLKALTRTPITEHNEGDTMNTEKPETPTYTEHDGLVTGWANATMAPDFDSDQVHVHEWSVAEQKKMNDTLSDHMTLADAEELISTAYSVAEEHRRRAEKAEQVATNIEDRLACSWRERNEAMSERAQVAPPKPQEVESAEDEATQAIPSFLQDAPSPRRALSTEDDGSRI